MPEARRRSTAVERIWPTSMHAGLEVVALLEHRGSALGGLQREVTRVEVI